MRRPWWPGSGTRPSCAQATLQSNDKILISLFFFVYSGEAYLIYNGIFLFLVRPSPCDGPFALKNKFTLQDNTKIVI